MTLAQVLPWGEVLLPLDLQQVERDVLACPVSELQLRLTQAL